MSESFPGDSEYPDRSLDIPTRYQRAAHELLKTCRRKMHEAGEEAEPFGGIAGGYSLEPPSTYDPDSEWDSIDVVIYPGNSKNSKGDEKLVKIEFCQDLDEEVTLTLIERFTLLLNSRGRLKVVRRFRLLDSQEENINQKEKNISTEEILSINEISRLSDTLFLCDLE